MSSSIGCVTGRFQPVHLQHLELFNIALERFDHLVVAVTNPDPGARRQEATSTHRHTSAANPFTYYERARLLGAALRDPMAQGRVTIVPFDLTRSHQWHQYVPPGAHHLVRAFSPWERDKAGRLSEAGYEVTVLDGDPQSKLHATDVRQALLDGDPSGYQQVPATVRDLLADMLERTPMEERL